MLVLGVALGGLVECRKLGVVTAGAVRVIFCPGGFQWGGRALFAGGGDGFGGRMGVVADSVCGFRACTGVP